jgi:elongation factor P--(R)-beta-lysine ligase
MNSANLRSRSNIIKLMRQFFDERGYTEMHTPRLVGLPGQEPHLEPFWTDVTESNGVTHPAALITSPEYAMKRLLAAGFDRIYDLGPCFRNNEPWDGTHDPEFLMLEWYRKNANLSSLMDETEEMLKWVASQFDDACVDVAAPFRRLTCAEAWERYADTHLSLLVGNREAMADVARAHGQTVSDADSWDDLYFKIFLTTIEPKLGEVPTFLYRYPVSQAALAKTCADDARFADRTELYINGLELANGFAELADSAEQRTRFEEEHALRTSLGKKTWPLDQAFLADLPRMGEAVGIAFGVDRLVMLLTGAKSINDVIPFYARERFSG